MSQFQDKTLVCKDCGKEFVFTAAEQEFYAQKGFTNEPKACKDCRMNRKNKMRGERESYKTICSNCGNEAIVPFKPRNDKPVLCDNCFKASRR